MTEPQPNPLQPSSRELPFVAPFRTLAPAEPLDWVRLGWRDFKAAPRTSLEAGGLIALLSLAIAALGWKFGSYWIEIALLSGFVFVAPVLAVIYYAVSWQIECGMTPTLGVCWRKARSAFGNLMVLALVLMIVFLLWGRAATVVHVFFPLEGHPSLDDLLPFLIIGSLIGTLFVLIAFACTAFSIPMLMDRRIDAITAVVTSINAVLRNKPAMAVWAALIVAAVAIGFATAMLGLAITMPVIGYATWHGYRRTIDASAYPPNAP